MRKLRQARGLTKEDLEGMTGLNRSDISDMVKGERNPSLRAVECLALTFEIEPAELFPIPEGSAGRQNSADGADDTPSSR